MFEILIEKMKEVLFFILCTIGYHAFSQERVTNIHVTDGETNEPLPFCHVCSEDIDNGITKYVTTDLEGSARFTYTGKTLISVSFIGYQTIIDTITQYHSSLTYKIYPGAIGLDEVVVTGQNRPIPVDKSIYSIKVIGAEKIERKASNNLAELLNTDLNIQINNDPSTGSSLKLQGISGENIKILIDGVPVIGRLNGNIDLSQINLNEVDHVEIVEGPMSVMYGSNALGGVINIITKENKYAKLKAGLDTYYESVGVYNMNGNVYLKHKGQDIGLKIGRNFFQGYSTDPDSRRKQWKPKEQYIAGIQYVYNKNRLKVKNKLDFFNERLLDRNNPSPPYYDKAHDTWFYTTRLNANTNGNYDFSGSGNLDLLLSYSYYSRKKNKYLKDLTNLETLLSPNESDNDTSVFNAFIVRGAYNSNNQDKNIEYQLGLDVNIETARGKRIENQYEDIGDYALFGSLQWKLNKKLIFQPAIRLAYNTKYKAPVVPSINFKYQLLKTNIRLSYARGFRAPSLKELYLFFYDSNHQIEGNTGLKAENSHNFNIAVANKNRILKKDAKIRLSGFYNQIFDKITLVQVDPDNPLHYRNENIGKYESLGGTFTFSVRPGRFIDMQLGISEIGRRDDYYESDHFIFSTNANTNLTVKFLKNSAAFSVFYKYIGRYPVYRYNDTGDVVINYLNDYHNMDISLSKTFFTRKLTVSTGIKNAFDNTEIQGDVADSGGAHGGGSSSMVGWGRTFFLGVKLNFAKYEN